LLSGEEVISLTELVSEVGASFRSFFPFDELDIDDDLDGDGSGYEHSLPPFAQPTQRLIVFPQSLD